MGGSLSLSAGADGHLDMTISSDNGALIAAFFDTFVISAPGLEFVTGPGEPDDLQLTNPAYVFPLADSIAAANPPAGIIGGTTFLNDTYFGFDSTIDGTAVTVPATGALLVTLHVVATSAQPGDVFTIGLDPLSSTFIDPNFNSLDVTSVSAEVQILGNANAAVPEPGSLQIVGAFGSLVALWMRRRRSGRLE